jgi:hypothetical protein
VSVPDGDAAYPSGPSANLSNDVCLQISWGPTVLLDWSTSRGLAARRNSEYLPEDLLSGARWPCSWRICRSSDARARPRRNRVCASGDTVEHAIELGVAMAQPACTCTLESHDAGRRHGDVCSGRLRERLREAGEVAIPAGRRQPPP